MHWFYRCASLLVAAYGMAPIAQAYETDFHYGLTFWLASKTGFTPPEAHQIASGNESTDTGMLDAKHSVVWQLCVRRDKTASGLTRELHFRSQLPPPLAPSRRVVSFGSPFASIAVNSVISEIGTDLRDQLFRFGRALHGWQDTFSHQGQPSPVIFCPDDLVWSHPKERDGPYNSHADVTHLHVSDCIQAAKSSSEKLAQLMTRIRPASNLVRWDSIEGSVTSFCEARTKVEKVLWLEKHGVPQARAIVKTLSIPNGTSRFKDAPELNLEPIRSGEAVATSSTPTYLRPRSQSPDRSTEATVAGILDRSSSAALPAPVVRWFEGFFRNLFTEPADLVPLILQSFAQTFAPADVASPPVQTLLRARLVDRGVSTGVSLISPTQFPADSWVTYAPDDWQSALVPARNRQNAPFLAGEIPDSNPREALAIAVMRHAPYEVLLVRANISDIEKPKLTNIGLLAIH